MGLLTNLVTTYAQSKAQEQAQQLQNQTQMINLMKYIISPESGSSPEKKAAASSFLVDIAVKHGGKAGREQAPQIASSLQRLVSGPQQMAGQNPANYTPTDRTSVPWDPRQAQQAATQSQQAAQTQPQHAPFRQRLGHFAGTALGEVGRALGRPETQEFPELPAELRGSFIMTPEQQAAEQARVARQTAIAQAQGAEAGGDVERDAYRARIRKDVEEKVLTPEEGDEAMKTYDVTGKPPIQRVENKNPIVVTDEQGLRHTWTIGAHSGQYYDERGVLQPGGIPTGWNVVGKLGTEKMTSDQMASQLRAPYQSAVILMTRQHQGADGTWEKGWDAQKVDREAKIQAAIQIERLQGVGVRTKELNLERDSALAALSGEPPPAPWGSAGAEFNAQVDAALGKAPPTAYDQPVPKQGEALTNTAQAAAFDEFVMRATGFMPMGGRDQWAQLRYNYGLKIAMAQLGTNNPLDLTAVFSTKKAEAKALSDTVQREAGVGTLNEQLHAFGDLLSGARSRVDNTGVPLIDRYLQRATRGLGDLTGDQAALVGQLDTALNAVSRIYAQVLSNNGYRSAAMPHVGTEKEARETLQGYMSDRTIDAELVQMYREAASDQEVLGNRQVEQFNKLREALPATLKRMSGDQGGSSTSTPSAPPKSNGATPPPPSKTPMPKTGDELWNRIKGK